MERAVCTLYLNNRARTAGGAHTRVLSRTSAGVGGVAVERSAYRGIVSARARACVRPKQWKARGGNAVPLRPTLPGPLLTSLPPLCRPPHFCMYIYSSSATRSPACPSVNDGVWPDGGGGGVRVEGGSVGVGGGGGGHYVT